MCAGAGAGPTHGFVPEGFVAYQLAQGGRDTPVDLGEFAAGYLLRAILSP